MHPLFALLLLGTAAPSNGDDWPQWGGSRRDFRAVGVVLEETWSDRAPRVVWERELGNGNAAIVAGDDALYTLFGSGKTETVVALEPSTGRTRWSHTYDVSYEAFRDDFGGPHATPLLVGELLITVSIDARVHALDRETGKVRWSRDLVAEHDVDLPQSGYAASPLAWRDVVILPGLGGRAPGALALSLETGETAWARHAFLSSHASPLLVDVGGRDHVVFHGMNLLVGLDPSDGALLWRTRLRTDAMDNVAFSPLWDAEREQFIVSHPYDGVGTRALRISARGAGFEVEQAWTNRRLKVEHTNGVLLDGVLYASDGSSPAYLTAVDLATGDRLFKQRGIAKATLLGADGLLLILDEEGVLRLGRPQAEGVEVVGELQVLRSNAWTVPTLIGKRLYVRDRFRIKALELP